jgi:nucleotide-binding universal stress UspA family protein
VRYRKILAALDRSPQSDVVFEQALELAKKHEAALMLFYCLPFEMQGFGSYADIYGRDLINFSAEMQALLQQESEQARQWLIEYCQKATEQGVPTEWDLKVGDAGSQIRKLADAWDADLIVVGRRGRRGLAEIVLGSVSSYVVHHVPRSVLVVQGISPHVPQNFEVSTQAKSR